MPERKSALQAILGGFITIPQETKKARYRIVAKCVYTKGGKIYVREVAEDANPSENEKALISKIEKLEKTVSELTEVLSPEGKENAEIMQRLKAIKGAGS